VRAKNRLSNCTCLAYVKGLNHVGFPSSQGISFPLESRFRTRGGPLTGLHSNLIHLLYSTPQKQVIIYRRFRNYRHIFARSICSLFICLFFILSGVRLSPLGTAATTGLLYQPRMIGDCDCVEIGRMKIGRGNVSTRRKPAPEPFCPPQIPHD
jgi:hypothetical protein